MTDEDQQMQICAYVPVTLSQALDRVAKRKGLARARAIEQAVAEYVHRETPFACPGCKNLVMMRMRFCPNCGRPLTEEDAQEMEYFVERVRRGG
jgi:rRNA maturation endonuclease Nob1